MKTRLVFRGLLAAAVVIAAALALSWDYAQDDAYISYRYVANYLNGDGLVFNVGERVEGFTNFGWVIWLLFWGVLGVNFLAVSKFTGLLFGLGIVILTGVVARRSLPDQPWLAGLVALIVAVNPSLAYWAPAGLETAAFAFFTLLSIYCWRQRNNFLIWSLLIAVWLRPEGALVAGLLVIIEMITERRINTFALRSALIALVLSLPYVAFKIVYYGSLFPNPFYAKTGFSIEQLQHGLDYIWLFLSHYALWGAAFILPLVLWRFLAQSLRVFWLFYALFTVYILLIGGDVLEVHRFFIPLLPLNAILFVGSIFVALRSQAGKTAVSVTVVAALLLAATSYIIPSRYVTTYYTTGQGLNNKMQFLARRLEQVDSTNFTVAASTIGVFGYELIGHDLIDLVGLTDTVVSRHPQPEIPNLESGWREPHYNTSYLLERAPDYIIFSTGVKPTAPGEKALFLYGAFIDAYRTIGFSYRPDNEDGVGSLAGLFKKRRRPQPPFDLTHPPITAELFQRGIDAANAAEHTTAIARFDSARAVSPEPVNPYLQYRKGLSFLMLGRHNRAIAVMDSLLARDSTIFEAHKDLYLYARMLDSDTKAATHAAWIQQLAPWYWSRAKEIADDEVARYRAAQQQRLNR